MWDAYTGAALLELKGHTYGATIVSFSMDGNQIITGGDECPTKVWDARTGHELKVATVPRALQPGYSNPNTRRVGVTIGNHVSPDGRTVALIIGNHIELTPMQPNDEELANRRFQMQPNFRVYREAYDAATKANDAFAARFYLNLFPPAERALIRAEPIVASLFTRLIIRADVLAALQAQPIADPEVQAACLKLAGTWSESASACNNAAWAIVNDSGRPEAEYQRGLRLALAACRLEPGSANYLNTLGVTQYRCGLMTDALATLTRSNDINKQSEFADLAFLALAQQHLGQSHKASISLSRLREVMKNPKFSGNPEAHAFLREAETIELDRVFPARPFAP